MRVDRIDGLCDDIDGAAAETEPSHRFLTRAWFQAAVDAYELGSVCTLVGRRANGDVGIALPLVSVGPRLVGARQVPGSYYPFRSFPIARDMTVDEVGEFLSDRAARAALGPVWRVGPIHESAEVSRLLRDAARLAGWQLIVRRIATSFIIDLPDAQDARHWPRASTQKTNRYLVRQLASHGAVEWRFVRGLEWSTRWIDDLAVVEARSWVGTRTDRSTAKLLPQGSRRFWEMAIRDPNLARHVTAAMLYVGARPIAFSLDLECGLTKYVIANSYDRGFAKYSPGKLLSYQNLFDAMARGIQRVDWGGGDSGYKQTTGARAGPEIVDYLLIRGRYIGKGVARLASSIWSRSGQRIARGTDPRTDAAPS